MLDTAYEYIEKDWRIFPLVAGTKLPHKGSSGLKDATLDRAQITRWWTENPNDNIAISTEASSLVVVDIDINKETGDSGWDAWCKLVNDIGAKEPKTYEVSTPTGGHHIYFQANPNFQVKSSTSKLAPLIDTRAKGGYVVAAGSRTHEGEYICVSNYPVARLPHWLRGLLARARVADSRFTNQRRLLARPVGKTRGTAEQAYRYECAIVAGTTKGSRNNVLREAAWNLSRFIERKELTKDEVYKGLMAAASLCGLADFEAHNTIKSSLKHRGVW